MASRRVTTEKQIQFDRGGFIQVAPNTARYGPVHPAMESAKRSLGFFGATQTKMENQKKKHRCVLCNTQRERGRKLRGKTQPTYE